MTEEEIKQKICDIGKRIYWNGYVAANDGNITVRINENEIITTPTGISKGFMTPDMLVKADMNGNIIESHGNYRPSSELKMHLRVYKERKDIFSVVHAHCPYATSFAIAGIPLTKAIMPEATISLGMVPIAKYGTPSTNEIPDAISEYLQKCDAMLLENHGVLTYGQDLTSAYYKLESVEFFAKLTFLTDMLGGGKEFTDEQIDKLYEVRKKLGAKGCYPGVVRHNEKTHNTCGKQIDEITVKRIVKEVTENVLKELNK